MSTEHSHTSDHFSDDHHHDDLDNEDYGDDFDVAGDPSNPMDNVFLTTIGVDVGSSTFHLMFSQVHLRRKGENLSSRYEVVGRSILWQSEIGLTPYSGRWIDTEAIRAVVVEGHIKAGLRPEDVDSGAVILTGEALRQRNARALADVIAAGSGKFVCVSAGHNLESMLAAFGSGAVKYSEEHHVRLFHIDIGGGTTKLAFIDNGQVRATAAIMIGGRQVATNEKREVVSISAGNRTVAQNAGIDVKIGEVFSVEDEEKFVAAQVAVLIDIANRTHRSALERKIRLTRILPRNFTPDAISFSGGVAEYIYERETRAYGDLGPKIGRALNEAIANREIDLPVVDPGEGIRATVVGASQCSVQLSGNTICLSNREMLPLRNVPVVHPDLERKLADGPWDAMEVSTAIKRAIKNYGLIDDAPLALAFSWTGEPSYPRMKGLAMGLQDAVGKPSSSPVIVLIDSDVGESIGRLLLTEFPLQRPLVFLDGLDLSPLDFVDVGQILEPSGTLPVIIKSLLFSPEGT